jgi:hypothetical protein
VATKLATSTSTSPNRAEIAMVYGYQKRHEEAAVDWGAEAAVWGDETRTWVETARQASDEALASERP